MAELLIIVAIISVLVAVSIPVLSSQLEKSREATDLANVRSAYAQVMSAAIMEDTSSSLYQNGRYQLIVPLKQVQRGWTIDESKLVIGGIRHSDINWIKDPQSANGRCKVYYSDGSPYLNWVGEDHINTESARDFLTKEVLETILGNGYKHNVINSNETYAQGGGTQKFTDYAKEHGFDLKDYNAATWQIYAKDPSGNSILSSPAIYWSTLSLTDSMVGSSIPVMGYRNGKYDVYYAKVVTYNSGSANKYHSIQNNFANITESGGSATFQFDNYKNAKSVYDQILDVYKKNGTLTPSDLKDYGL